MQNLLDDKHNLNFDIFTIPAQEGGSEEDNYLASIGDAVQQHVQSLSHGERQLWDSLLHMDNTGAIFRVEDSPFHRDTDPFNLQKEENLEKAFQIKIMTAFKGQEVDEEFVKVLREEFEKEVERRQKSEDIADIGIPIPYHDWEKFPQMHKHWDIEPTPKPLFIYMGQSKSYFYDSMPEHHPDKNNIEKFFQLINKDWDEITEEFSEWAITVLDSMTFSEPGVNFILSSLMFALASGDKHPETLIENALNDIDQSYQETYRNESIKLRDKDPIHQILNLNSEVWENQSKNGLRPYGSIKKLGQTLYENHLDKTNKSHWARYRKFKKDYAPVLLFKGIDLNRASVYDLKRVLNISDSSARELWFARPFDNLGAFKKFDFLNPTSITSNKQTENALYLIDKKLSAALESNDSQVLTNLGKTLRNVEVKKLTKISTDEWQTIWFYYRIAKADMFNTFNARERKKNNDVQKRQT